MASVLPKNTPIRSKRSTATTSTKRSIVAIDSRTLELYSDLLGRFGQIAAAQQPRETFLEIAKLQTSELVYSNLWKFFLSPDERHGLGDLVLRSLLEASGVAVDASG